MNNKLKELLDNYILNKSLHLKENTIINIKSNLYRYFYIYLLDNKINIKKISPDDIYNYYIYIESLPLLPQSINLIISMILNFIDYLDVIEFIKPKITRKFKQIFIRLDNNLDHKNNYLNNEEINTLLNSFNQDNDIEWYYRFTILTLIYTGLRRGELYGLTWNDIDFDNNTILVNKQYSIQMGKILKYTKTNNTRIIYIPEWLTTYFKIYRNKSNSSFIFNHRNINSILTKACIKCGIKRIKLHDLRHTFCTMLYSNNIDGKYIQIQMGHKSESTSRNIYKHLSDNILSDGINKINSFAKI